MQDSTFLPASPTFSRRWLFAILALGIILRLLLIFVIDPQPAIAGGDIPWYLEAGLELVTNTAPPLQPGPGYLVYLGCVQLPFPDSVAAMGFRHLLGPFYSLAPLLLDRSSFQFIRFLNIGWHGLLIAAIYWLGCRYFNAWTGRIGALIIAVSPAFIIEAGTPLTESVFLGLLFGTLALYASYQDRPSPRIMVGVGVLLGMATLTRAVLLLFPLVLVIHLIKLHGFRRGLKFAAFLLVSYGLIISTWTVYNALRWNRLIIGADGLFAFAWQGAVGQKSPADVDRSLGNAAVQDNRNSAFVQQLAQTIRDKLPDYLKARFSNILDAYLQPHNTTYFPGESLKDIAANWWQQDRSLGGLLRLLRGDAFWPKLILYLFHYWAMFFGLIGILLNWRRLWVLLPLVGYLAYTTALHSILLALPRYLFPVEPVLILFGAASAVSLFRRAPSPALGPVLNAAR